MQKQLFILAALLAAAGCQVDPTAPTRDVQSARQLVTVNGAWIITEVDLPNLGASSADCSGFPGGGAAYDLNNDGYVVGWSCFLSPTGKSVPHAVRWHPASGSMWDLARGGDEASIATGINDNGVIVGTVGFDPATGQGGRAFVYDDRIGITPLRTLGGSWSSARKVNINNDVVGESETTPGDVRAFAWEGGPPMHSLGRLRHANDVDDAGAIAGGAIFEPGKPEHAAVAHLGGSVSDYGIRGRRAVLTSGPPFVGNYYVDGSSNSASRAFIATAPWAFQGIPTLGGTANAALGSAAGPVAVGWSDDAPGRSPIRDAYLWSPLSGTLRLHVSPMAAATSSARAINAQWQIAGSRQVQSMSIPVFWTVIHQD